MWWCGWPNLTARCDHFSPSALVPLLSQLWLWHLLEPLLSCLRLEENSFGICKENWTDLFSTFLPAPWKAFFYLPPPPALVQICCFKSVWQWKARQAVVSCKNWIVASQVCRNGGGGFGEMRLLSWQHQVVKVHQWNWVTLFTCKFFSCFPKHFSCLNAIHV